MKNLILAALLMLPLFSCKKNADSSEKKTSATDTLRQKNGTVLTYQKPLQKLILLKRDQTVYSEGYQNRLRKIAEYYIANSKQNLVKFHTANTDKQIGYSIEENDWEEVNYTQIGIFSKSGNNLSTMQWLFYDPKSQKLYEFDLNTNQLAEFPMGN